MVQLAVEGLAGQAGLSGTPSGGQPGLATDLEVIHVDARLSDSIGDIGHFAGRKLWRVLRYCGQAISARFRRGVKCFYYVPAPGLRAAVYRDWIVMAMCRPFFPVLIYHWHAMGLGEWIEQTARPWERWISRWLLHRPELSIVLGEVNRRDAELMRSGKIAVVPNAIPDPCPAFDQEILPVRQRRAAERMAVGKPAGVGAGEAPELAAAGPSEPLEFRVIFVGLCHPEKGLFDAVEAIALANRRLDGGRLRVTLTVAGGFWREEDRVTFERRIQERDLLRAGLPLVSYVGFVTGAEKRRLFAESDALCFPTYYAAESFGLVVVEAMAWGLHVVATRWRTVPELLPPGHEGLVEVKSPKAIADRLIELAFSPYTPTLRARYLDRYTTQLFATRLRAVLEAVVAE